VTKWQNAGKKVLLSVGGANALWGYTFASSASMQLSINSIVSIVSAHSLDGIDLDIESYNTDPTIVASWIHNLKLAIGNKIITIGPECVGIYSGVTYTPGTWQSWNYWVPIINTTINDIDLVMVQAYNNWYEQAEGSLAYFQDVYLNWRNQPSATFCSWCTPIPNFTGVPESKLAIGILASTSAGNGGYYAPPATVQALISWF